MQMDNKELMQLFLQGQLDEAGQAQLADLVESDLDLASQLEIEAAFYAKRSASLKEDLKKLQPTSKDLSSNKSSVSIVKLISSIAAGILICVLSYYTISNYNSDNNYQYLASDLLSIKHMAPVTLMGENNNEQNWDKAIRAYKDSEYPEVIAIINSVDNPTAEQVLYAAISKLYLAEPDNQGAIDDLKKILTNEESIFADQAKWFLALAHSQSNNEAQAKRILKSIINTRSWQHENASQLLIAME